MNLMVISGMSGAGKATAARAFEDMAFTVVDNMPPVLLPELVERCTAGDGDPPAPSHLAVVLDTRSGMFFDGWQVALERVRAAGVRPTILFLDAADDILVKRFKETRRRHPLFDEHGGILGSLHAERALLESLREASDKIIDTSDLDVHQLRGVLKTEFAPSNDHYDLTITVASFGFKHGLPLDADLVFDVRFLINPHYVPELRSYDGRNVEVRDYVMGDPDSALFLDKLYSLMEFSVPQYLDEGKAYLTVAIGCTGGRHRSVVVAEMLGDFLKSRGYRVLIQHRDVNK
ncbi:MAG: RNase adapter RapZ [Capsulimonadaceae bacterium]